MPSTLSAVTLNSARPAQTARFWAAALGGEAGEGGNGFIHVRAPGLLLIVQSDPGRDDGPDGVHLDLHADDRPAEVSRLVALGAHLVAERHDSHGAWTVLRDPDGREFCVGG